ncbi:MAG: glutamine-hydrolyzing carbamoyl-phosphate synthase small subunit [Planctomycetaceae bacterium]|nr:glutamine-hydrolyzing carbamoyl-phosphate synthase small subunit [Planctomycetaceae bacterium]
MEHSTIALKKRTPSTLALEDGRCFHGISVGFEGIANGNVIFNSTMVGYQEVLTDPASAGQIVAFTTPQIGNTGVNSEDNESLKPTIRGLLIRELSTRVSNWRATESLPDFLKRNQIVALSEIDTRSLTQHLRSHGTKRGIIAAGDWNPDELVKKAQESPRLEEMNLVESLRVTEPTEWSEADSVGQPVCNKRVAVVDFGVKRSMLRSLASLGAKITLFPATSSAENILKFQPECVVLSGGPDSPAELDGVVGEIQKLIGKVPILGIALGQQLLGKALGAETQKLPFGHYGTQPVLDKRTGRVEMTQQNHRFCLVPESLPPEVYVSHINLNDNTVAGFRHKSLPIVAAQFWAPGLFECVHNPEAHASGSCCLASTAS